MIEEVKGSIKKQFGASINMLEHVLQQYSEEHIQRNKKFYYIAFHSLILLDYYLTIPPSNFIPYLPFTIKNSETIPEGVLGDAVPDKLYHKAELMDYLSKCRQKCFKLIDSLTEDSLNIRFTEEGEEEVMDYSILEILLYNMRHLQHHIGQLNMLMRQEMGRATPWVFEAKNE